MPKSSFAVRLFLSTTYRDMRAEREYLHTEVFPQMMAWYAPKGVTFKIVDLGWKATEEQAEGFAALKLSLDEVEKCLPFFLGLVGLRYGRPLEKIKREAM